MIARTRWAVEVKLPDGCLDGCLASSSCFLIPCLNFVSFFHSLLPGRAEPTWNGTAGTLAEGSGFESRTPETKLVRVAGLNQVICGSGSYSPCSSPDYQGASIVWLPCSRTTSSEQKSILTSLLIWGPCPKRGAKIECVALPFGDLLALEGLPFVRTLCGMLLISVW